MKISSDIKCQGISKIFIFMGLVISLCLIPDAIFPAGVGTGSALFITDYEEYHCDTGSDPCPGNVISTNPNVSCRPTIDCELKCAGACGDTTLCISDDCANCCDTTTCITGAAPKYTAGSDEKKACMEACKGRCEVNTEFCNLIKIIKAIALSIAVFMISISGLKFMIAEDAMGRKEARDGIIYVITGIIIIAIASILVTFVLGGNLGCP